MFYTENFSLSTIICDEDDRLTVWGLARLFQDIACAHSDSLGVGFEGLKSQHKAWVLTRAYYNISRFPSAGEKLTLKTWPKQDNGLFAPRDYQLFDEQGNICATSASYWVLIDTETRRVCRLNDIIKRFEKELLNATKLDHFDKMIMPEGLQLYKHIDVPYSALDHTRHVNNAEYIKWICDSIPEICMPRNTVRAEILEFDINYIKETKYADLNVNMNFLNDDHKLYFQINNTNGIAVNAKVIIA